MTLTWFEAKNILQKASIGIVPRQGWPIKNSELKLIKDLGGETEVLPLEIPASASSSINNEASLSQIPSAILSILKEKNLYGRTL